MAATYPEDIAVLTNPVSGEGLNQPSTGVSHSVIETRQNEEIIAIETELGVGLKGTKLSLAERIAVSVNDDGTLKVGGGSLALEDLTDVDIQSSTTNGQLLKFDGGLGKWINWSPNFLTTFTESDPVFTAWDKSTGISITESQISDLQAYVTGTPWTGMGYLTSETSHADVVVDGDFTSQGIMLRGATTGIYSILTDSSANWNTAYGWGNHAGLYSLTSHGHSLDDLSNISIGSGLSEGQMLVWDSGESVWKNSSTSYISSSSTNSFTNKRLIPRVSTITTSATPTFNTDNYDGVTITGLDTNITSMTSGLSGSPNNFEKLTIRIKDDGTARTIAWGTSYASRGATLPTTTVLSKILTVGFIYNSVTSTWDCVASAQEI